MQRGGVHRGGYKREAPSQQLQLAGHGYVLFAEYSYAPPGDSLQLGRLPGMHNFGLAGGQSSILVLCKEEAEVHRQAEVCRQVELEGHSVF